ncbi:MAG: TNT domain-containing protein [Nocardioides sp.]
MPDFTIRGNPGAIRSKAATTTGKGQLFFDTGEALGKISVEGWTGRAADHFRDAHDLEPDRWVKAGNGFLRGGNALNVYATAVENAQATARWAADEYARGEQVSQDARSAYDADVSRARDQAANAAAAGQVMTLTIIPFDDPGQAIRDNAVREFETAKATLDAAAHTCADEVRRGCDDAPEEPGWLESGLRFVGGVLEGAGEALWDLATLTPFSPVNMIRDLTSLATGDLTPEELMAKYELSLETAQGMLDALIDDPVTFGKELGKGLLDWDTWADDPARALGHLAPDAIMAALTAGSGTVATRGAGATDDALGALSDLSRLDDLGDLNRLDDLGDLNRLDDLGDLNRLDDLGDGPPSSMFEYDGSDFRNIDDQLTDPSYSPDNRDIIDPDYDVLGGRSLDEFNNEFLQRNPPGSDYPYDWNWPPDQGKVPGTDVFLDPADTPPMDRIGGPNGTFFTDEGAPMSERSLPPDRLNFDRSHWEVNTSHPDLASGDVRIERSEVAPWFGQEGGGNQYRFLDANGEAISMGEAQSRGLIAEPSGPGLDVPSGAAGGLTAHGLESLDRFVEEQEGPR